MSKVKVIILAGFLITLGAGWVMGLLTRQKVVDRPPPHRPTLVEELRLSPAQAEQLKQIWESMPREARRHQDDLRQGVRKERDDAVVALLTPAQKTAYEKIQEQYTAKMTELAEQRGKPFQGSGGAHEGDFDPRATDEV